MIAPLVKYNVKNLLLNKYLSLGITTLQTNQNYLTTGMFFIFKLTKLKKWLWFFFLFKLN